MDKSRLQLWIWGLMLLLITGGNVSAALVAHLEFEGDISDSSSNNIAFTGAPGSYVTGPGGFGEAMEFNKAAGNVVYAESISSELSTISSKITIAFWAYGANNLPYPQTAPTVVFSANDPGNWSRVSMPLPHSQENQYVFFDVWDISSNFNRVYKYVGDTPQVYKGQWNHWAFVKDTTLDDSSPANSRVKIYLNGALWLDSSTSGYDGGTGVEALDGLWNIYIGAEKQYWNFYDGALDDFRIYDDALNDVQVAGLMVPVVGPKANTPNPVDGSGGHAPHSVVLSWYPGTGGISHDVYLGQNSAAVASATTGSPEYQGSQSLTSYDPGTLDPNTVYYWRIDEFDGGSTVAGDVWSFSVVPDASGSLVLHYEFSGNLDDSAGSGVTLTGDGPGGTAGGYVGGPAGFGQGLNFNKTAGAYGNAVYAEGIGSTLSSITNEITICCWAKGSSLLPSTGDPTILFSANDSANWSRISLQYPYDSANDYVFYDTWSDTGVFDRAYKYTGDNQFYKDGYWHHLAFVKNITAGDSSPADARMKIYVDGALWHDSTVGYGGGDGTANLDGIENIYIGAEKQYWYFWDGQIDDFRIYNSELSPEQIGAMMEPVIGPKAYSPDPFDGATDLVTSTNLAWFAGKGAVSHDVYFGTDFTAVDTADPNSPEFLGNQTAINYDLPGLSLGMTYYWRIDEVGGGGTVKGDVWSFSTRDFVALDDFEVYSDTAALNLAWITDPNDALFLETGLSSGGSQSMRMEYGNQHPQSYTEGTLNVIPDWTVNGMAALSLNFRGAELNENASLYLKVIDNEVPANTALINYSGAATIAKSLLWRQWNIDLQDISGQGVNLANVAQLVLGVVDPNTATDSLYFDDIRLYPARCVSAEAVADWIGADCLVAFPELAVLANDWMEQAIETTGYDGIVTDSVPDPNWVAGQFNNGLDLAGTTSIEVSADVLSTVDREITISLWAYGNPAQPRDDAVLQALAAEGEAVLNINISWSNEYTFWDTGYGGRGAGGAVDRIAKLSASSTDYKGSWVHWVFTKNADASNADVANARMKIYRNGVVWHNSSGFFDIGDGTSSISGATTLVIGSGTSGGYDAILDDVRIYDTELTQSEIQSIADGSPGIAGTPVLQLKLDESSGTLADDTGSSSGATIVWPFNLETNLSSSNPEKIDFADLAELVNQWIELQLFP